MHPGRVKHRPTRHGVPSWTSLYHSTSCRASRRKTLAEAAEVNGSGGRVVAVQADVTPFASTRALVEQTVEVLGGLDILVSNANVAGPLFIRQAAAEVVAEGGRIVLLSSVSASIAVPGHSLHAASKAAVSARLRPARSATRSWPSYSTVASRSGDLARFPQPPSPRAWWTTTWTSPGPRPKQLSARPSDESSGSRALADKLPGTSRRWPPPLRRWCREVLDPAVVRT